LGSLDHGHDLTFFELLTGAAFLLFAEAGIDCAVLEAGMGGRWDATRLAASPIVGLTNVGTDHRRWLGDDREAIAADKGAALAAGAHAVLGPQVDAAIVPHLGAPHAVPAGEIVALVPTALNRVDASWDDGQAELEVPLEGRHQRDNLHLALALTLTARSAGVLDGIDPAALPPALAGVRWPARLSRHFVQGRQVLVDGAHNAEGASVLASYLVETGFRCNLLFSCLEDKPVEIMAAALRPHVARVAICQLADERAMPLARLRRAFPEAVVASDPLAALALLPDPVLVAGSLRLAGAVLAAADQ
jgi:dihydrofolate synthase/folylpolyglutamate synthase